MHAMLSGIHCGQSLLPSHSSTYTIQSDQTPHQQDELELEYILRSAFQLWSGDETDATVHRLANRLDHLAAVL
jgi:hypothetical protein